MEAICFKLVLRNWGVRVLLFTFESQFCGDDKSMMPCAIDVQLTVSESGISPLLKALKLNKFTTFII